MVKKTTIGVLVLVAALGLVVLLYYRSQQREIAAPVATKADTYLRLQQPEMFSYEELLALGTTDNDSGAVRAKLHTLTTTPFISNEAYYRSAMPHRPLLKQLGRSLRVVTWNIERGLELDGIKLLFANTDEFLRRAKRNEAKVDLAQMRQDIDVLKSADVLVLNEVDWGLKRTGYRSVVEELGVVLNMNWAYGIEFIEVDPITLGTETLPGLENPVERQQLLAEIHVDKTKLKSLHGTVVLSRYPIREALLKPFLTVGYDWYEGEKKGLDILEKGERAGAEAAFLEKVTRQIRRGGRTALIVTLDVPELKEQRLTVAATHLESNASPESRRKEMEELRFAPHFSRRLDLVNYALPTRLSDHDPISVDLPFAEPPSLDKNSD